jgi:adenosylcobyric acid synthase
LSARAIMFQGTGSDVGKSIITAGFCRLALRRGLKTAPFKPQNMSNNAAVTACGGEIGRAQALQARAAGQNPRVDFNPVLIKPQSDRIAQIVVHGKPHATLAAHDYMHTRDTLLGKVRESYERLRAEFDLIVVEGAGSPAETNLRKRDIANMGFARAAGAPVILIGDIDRGGVIAAIAGTKLVLDPADQKMIAGFIINKFRGDPALFKDGAADIAARTGWRDFGLVPWIEAARRLPAEDAMLLDGQRPIQDRPIRIATPMLSRISNFDDFDPLQSEPDVEFAFVSPGSPIPRDADVIILPGTKSTRGDLEFLRQQGWDIDILAHARAGGRVFGVCGGYQMLGRAIHDPLGADGEPGESHGLGLLDVSTRMQSTKTVRPIAGACAASGAPIKGYEIHVGETTGADCVRPVLVLEDNPDGATSRSGRISGCYVHGLFHSDAFRGFWLGQIKGGRTSTLAFEAQVEDSLDALADVLETSLDVNGILAAAHAGEWRG